MVGEVRDVPKLQHCERFLDGERVSSTHTHTIQPKEERCLQKKNLDIDENPL